MIKVDSVRVWQDGEEQRFTSIAAANVAVSDATDRYDYEIIWQDGTKHFSRSRERSITRALETWIDNFTYGPADAPEAERKAYLAKVPAGIQAHLKRLTQVLEH